MAVIDRETLRDLVTKWAAGMLNEQEVHESAEEYCETFECPEIAEDDSESVAVEVLSQLEILNHQLVTQDDVPAILDFLNSPIGAESAGWEAWRSYWNEIDFESRKLELQESEYYVT